MKMKLFLEIDGRMYELEGVKCISVDSGDREDRDVTVENDEEGVVPRTIGFKLGKEITL